MTNFSEQLESEHKTYIQVRFYDIDLMGHIYNVKYQEFFDVARLKYFEEKLGALISGANKGLIIASIKIDYVQSVFLNDELLVVSHVTKLGGKSLEMTQQIYRNNQSEPVVIGKTTMVCFDMKRRVSEAIPDEWRKKFIECEPGLQVNQSVREV